MKQVIGFVIFAILLCERVHGQNLTEPGPRRGSPSGRIVNGTAISIQNVPFVLRLRVNGYGICGATAITNTQALTAAHCLDTRPSVSTVSLYGGSTSQYSGGVEFYAKNYVLHPNYTKSRTDHDAAIVTTLKSFAGTPNIVPLSLIAYELPTPSWCQVVGWGYTNGLTKTTPENLQSVWLQLLSHNSCASIWGAQITPQMICAQYSNVDICNGDSGGPLLCNGQLTGIVSWGAAGCPGLWPTVFGKILSTSIRSFIRTNAGV